MRVPKRSPGSQSKRRSWPRFHVRPPRGPRSFVGVDIDATAVKLVELSRARSGDAPQARCWGVEPLPLGAVEAAGAGAVIGDANAVGEAIRRLRTRIGAKARGAALAVPHAAALHKTLRVDADLGDDDLEVEVALEAERHIPFPPEETALDFEPSHLCLDDPALVEVEVVACRLEHVYQREAAAAAGGLKAAVVEVETAALARAAHLATAHSPTANGGDIGPILLAALGAHTTTLLAIDGEAVVFAHQEPGPAEELAAGPADGLARQVARLSQRCMTAPGVHAPQRLLLAGDRAAAPGLAKCAAEHLGLAVQVANPFPGDDATSDSQPADGPALMAAYGLAQRGWTAVAGVAD